jgi:hypothetical protein
MEEEFLKINFVPTRANADGLLVPPVPAIRNVPEWYKGLAKHNKSNSEKTLHPENHIGTDGAVVATKQCPPFLDAMTAGYHFVLEDDLHVDIDDDGKPILWWNGDLMILDQRPTNELPVPNNCHPIHYGFKMNWYYETPPGYSVLITHPMNRYDLPFIVQSGIVESDIWGLPVFIAFYLNRNFRGVIPKGTPIFQMIPFKRDNWEMSVTDTTEEIEKHDFAAEKRRTKIHGYYKWFAWRKKIFRVGGSSE